MIYKGCDLHYTICRKIFLKNTYFECRCNNIIINNSNDKVQPSLCNSIGRVSSSNYEGNAIFLYVHLGKVIPSLEVWPSCGGDDSNEIYFDFQLPTSEEERRERAAIFFGCRTPVPLGVQVATARGRYRGETGSSYMYLQNL